jgi:hypothetical protein
MKNMKKSKRLILGEGEIIGHKHALECKKDIEYEVTNDRIKFMLKDMGILTHDEHDRMVFEKGLYYSYNQVEFNPFSGIVERVFD